MAPFRKGGSFVRFLTEGDHPSPEDDAFYPQLAEQRFRTIENAANEGMSVGWVSPTDPSGHDFLRDEIHTPPFVRLRIRMDRKKLPAAWLAIHLSAEIRARGGQRISPKERKDIKADIEDQILPRILPSVQFIDVLWLPDQRLVLLFSTSQVAAAECAKLFHRTFGLRLIEADPTQLALRAKLEDGERRALEDLRPFTLKEPGTNGAPKRRVSEVLTAEAGEASA